MKVRDVMTSDVGYCQPNTTLAQAAMIMWQRDCGVVPVVNELQRVVGMITDRDICIAVSIQNRLASQIKVNEIIYGEVQSCRPDDELENVLKKMRKRQLRRLPVTSKDGVLLGIISIGDLLNAAKGKEIKKKLLSTLREISSFRPLQLHEISADESPADSDTGSNVHLNTDASGASITQHKIKDPMVTKEVETVEDTASDNDDAEPMFKDSGQ